MGDPFRPLRKTRSERNGADGGGAALYGGGRTGNKTQINLDLLRYPVRWAFPRSPFHGFGGAWAQGA